MIQLVQTWQEFKVQSNNLTLAADIVDRPTEQSELQASNIPMPPIAGRVSVQGVDFRYSEEGPQILNNVSMEVPEGMIRTRVSNFLPKASATAEASV